MNSTVHPAGQLRETHPCFLEKISNNPALFGVTGWLQKLVHEQSGASSTCELIGADDRINVACISVSLQDLANLKRHKTAEWIKTGKQIPKLIGYISTNGSSYE